MKTLLCCCAVLLATVLVAAEELPRLAPPGAPGGTMIVRGRVLDGQSRPVAGARVLAYHADHEGQYHDDAYRGTLTTDLDGRFAFETSRPGGYGPAPHVHFKVAGDGFRDQLATLRLSDEDVPRRTVELRGEPVEELSFEIRVRRD